MDITDQAARESLSTVRNVMSRTRKSVEADYAGGLLLLWGAIWTIEFILTHFMPERIGLIFNSFSGAGILATLALCWRWRSRAVAQTAPQSRIGLRIFLMWAALGVYAVLWLYVAQMPGGIRMCVFLCTVAMLGYVMIGLWFQSYFMVYLGAAVTVLATVGLWIPSEYFFLWMAPTGGGSLLGTGMYIRWRWRQT